MPQKKPIGNSGSFSALSLAWELGYLIAIPLIVFALAGRWLDKIFQSSPLFLLIGLFFALVVTTFFVYQKTIKLTSDIENKK
jgi:F0F1-type ATP synthase assembly protein I